MRDDTLLPVVRDWTTPALAYAAQAVLFHPCISVGDAGLQLRGRLIYLATPYSKIVLDEGGAWCPTRSMEAGLRAAAWARLLASVGVSAVSPIAQAADMVQGDFEDVLDPLDAAFWTRWCAPLLQACDAVVVPPMPGWDDSDGIWHEVREALRVNKPVYLIAEGGA